MKACNGKDQISGNPAFPCGYYYQNTEMLYTKSISMYFPLFVFTQFVVIISVRQIAYLVKRLRRTN
jgi:hypothetical protein